MSLPDFNPPKFSSYRVTLPQLEQMFGSVVALSGRAFALKLESGVTACGWLLHEAEPRLKAIQRSGDLRDAPTLYRALKEHGYRLEADIRTFYRRSNL